MAMLTADDIGKKVKDASGQTGTLVAIYHYKDSKMVLVRLPTKKGEGTAYCTGAVEEWEVMEE